MRALLKDRLFVISLVVSGLLIAALSSDRMTPPGSLIKLILTGVILGLMLGVIMILVRYRKTLYSDAYDRDDR